ncbi:hypothetical protein EVG20_g7543 [Dentipellis fragilis]|uniref:Uncharacterized protein n=1 Tax=Dentipellis fragilis TaxID=205917 RepID=A0A4Y9YD36_9AGAM|nr:hypothetical protein EVG20_g7543 [Dentipellis fragilis]
MGNHYYERASARPSAPWSSPQHQARHPIPSTPRDFYPILAVLRKPLEMIQFILGFTLTLLFPMLVLLAPLALALHLLRPAVDFASRILDHAAPFVFPALGSAVLLGAALT